LSKLNIAFLRCKSANKAEASQEIRPLTGVRGFAVAIVVLGHYQGMWITLLPIVRLLNPLASYGRQGVDLFFILSGFILSYVYKGAGRNSFGISEYGRFVWLRFARIWPNHVATLIVLALLVLVAKCLGTPLSGEYPFAGLPFRLTLIQAWPFIPEGPWGWNYPSWSISAEWFAYLFLFPVVWHALELKLKRQWWFILCYAFLAAWLFLLSTARIEGFYMIAQVSCEFLAGAMLFNVYLSSAVITRLCQRWVFIVLLALLAGMCFRPLGTTLASHAVFFMFPLLLLGLTAEASMTAKFFASRPMLWLGRISYALYMSHGIVQKVLKVVMPVERYQNTSLALRLIIVLVNILIMLLAAAVLYYVVEVPARNYLRNAALLSKRGPRARQRQCGVDENSRLVQKGSTSSPR